MSDMIERVARAIARAMGDNYADAFKDKTRWIAKRGMSGGRYRDVNEPMQCDYDEGAKAAIAAMQADAAPVDDRVSTSNPVDYHETGNVSDKLRDAAEVWRDALFTHSGNIGTSDAEIQPAAVIEADRQAVRTALVAEIVAWLRTASNGSDTTKYANVFADEIEAKWGKQ